VRGTGLTLALAGTTLALAGCGSGRLSHGDFVRQADAICSAYDAKVKLLTRPTSYDDVVGYVGTTLPLYVGALNQLAALKPPQSDEAAVAAWLAAGRKVTASLKQLRAAAMRHDLAATNDASSAVQAAGLASQHAAAALGLETCAAP
jgi:hypothetical protein